MEERSELELIAQDFAQAMLSRVARDRPTQLMAFAFDLAEKFLAERDRRREMGEAAFRCKMCKDTGTVSISFRSPLTGRLMPRRMYCPTDCESARQIRADLMST